MANIERIRAGLTEKNYLPIREKSKEEAEVKQIYNYDGSNVTDDPGKKEENGLCVDVAANILNGL